MRINEDYLDRVTIADIDDEDIDDVVESQEPSPGKWKFAAVIEVRQSNINYRKRIEQIIEMQTDDYNIFEMNNDFEDYLETNPLKHRNYVTQFDYKTDMFIVEFNCNNKPYILIYALASISDFFYSLTYESSKYDINQMIDYRQFQAEVYYKPNTYDQDEANEDIVRTIVDMIEYGIGQNYDYAELHEWVIKRQQERERKRRIR